MVSASGRTEDQVPQVYGCASAITFLVFNFGISPFIILITCIILGGLLGLVEGWTIENGFFFVAAVVTGLPTPFFTPDMDEITIVGEFAEIIISLLTVTIAGGVVGLAGLLNISTMLPHWLQIRDSPRNTAVTIILGIPATVLIFCAALGGIFALAEGWNYRCGFEFLVQTICGLSFPLTDRVPSHSSGKIIALVFAIASLGITSVIVGIVGQVALCDATISSLETQLGKWETHLRTLCFQPSAIPKIHPKIVQCGSSEDKGEVDDDTTNSTHRSS